MTTDARSSDYPLARTAAEFARLDRQRNHLAPMAVAMLDEIGVAPGWHCLDLACGPGGVTDLLSARVGPLGRVVGLDSNPDFVVHARSGAAANTEFVLGDAFRTGLPDQSFDLVHMRLIGCVVGNPSGLLAEAIRLTRPGGWVAQQEAEYSTLRCFPPHPAWDRLRGALEAILPHATGVMPVAQQLYRQAREAGLQEVEYRPLLYGVRAGDPWRDFLPVTVESLADAILGRGLLDRPALAEALAACRTHLADPSTVFCSPTLVQVWGRIPAMTS